MTLTVAEREIPLLRALPASVRTAEMIAARKEAKTPDVIRVASQFGRNYFDGDRAYGYGGYVNDGRWAGVAKDVGMFFQFTPWKRRRVLDIGCAKGFLVVDLVKQIKAQAYGIDISRYAVMNCDPQAVGRLHIGNAMSLPFPDKSFDVVLAINVLHNLDREGCIQALREIERVSMGDTKTYVQVDSYRNEEEKQRFLDWNLMAQTYGTPEEWLAIFEAASYSGFYGWTIT